MKKDYTHICIVLDASGSMFCIKSDVQGSFNGFIEEQRKAQGKTVFDLFQFSDNVERIVRSQDLSQFHDDLMAKYDCTGCTAMNDAICTAIDTVGQEFSRMPEDERPEHVLCAIITDGAENASREFTAKDVKDRIKRQTEVYNWEFDFLAANQDAFETGREMGLQADQCMNFSVNPAGVSDIAERLSCRAKAIRQPKK